jgi:CDGSH iron-sulfur domain-containing protein 3
MQGVSAMAKVRIRVRDNGPLLVEGPVEIVDAEGKSFQIATDKPTVALCRCGMSSKKPFCDGAHKSGFQSICRTAVESQRLEG